MIIPGNRRVFQHLAFFRVLADNFLGSTDRFYQITRSLVPGGIAATAWLASRCKVVKWLMILEGKGTEGMALVGCRVALCDLLRERAREGLRHLRISAVQEALQSGDSTPPNNPLHLFKQLAKKTKHIWDGQGTHPPFDFTTAQESILAPYPFARDELKSLLWVFNVVDWEWRRGLPGWVITLGQERKDEDLQDFQAFFKTFKWALVDYASFPTEIFQISLWNRLGIYLGSKTAGDPGEVFVSQVVGPVAFEASWCTLFRSAIPVREYLPSVSSPAAQRDLHDMTVCLSSALATDDGLSALERRLSEVFRRADRAKCR
ncbi:hypothetical protein CC1G_14715 [Coprinopsis cinerea okayama7|uniref:Uncharacterized protein n=1 Tax=Coprinopsis cinerea (strain Okayama-7 / 130 / ATCC MYA-4618 / FGSC 9003) TaxID=240176 RepID=D6RN04_COPC7|nr:hypothetical protein CC1G_14715 [Coprinopsis cinerea okayama7\|eukprot:XP_002911286.1 hypothetical protein CC1G_14715 [Coprinopsis cinerea okayama7\